MKAKLAVLFSEEALKRRQRIEGSQKKVFRAEGQRCMGTPRPTRVRGTQSPGVPPSVGSGMECAYEHALIRLEATDSPYLRQKIAGLYTDKETKRRLKARGERHAEKNAEEKPSDVASPRGIGAIAGPVTHTEEVSRDSELPNSGNEDSGNCVDGPLEEGRSRDLGVFPRVFGTLAAEDARLRMASLGVMKEKEVEVEFGAEEEGQKVV